MNETVHIENAVLGGGEAGKYLAWDLAQQGRPVVVIERALIGGSCPNIACLPSKNVIRSAKVADLVSRGASYGVRIEGASVDMRGVRHLRSVFTLSNVEHDVADPETLPLDAGF